jgi:hypothetical protein
MIVHHKRKFIWWVKFFRKFRNSWFGSIVKANMILKGRKVYLNKFEDILIVPDKKDNTIINIEELRYLTRKENENATINNNNK